MEDMFKGALVFNQYIGALNVSRVQSMESMFEDAHAFDRPIHGWDVSSVTSMGDMFQRAYSFNRPIGDWNTSSVTNMDEMFDDASAFEQDVSQWKGPAATSVATDRNMFYGATAFLAEFSCSVHGPASACSRKYTGPPKCVAPGGDKLQYDGTNWICVCVEGWMGETCDYSYLGQGECRQSDGSYPIKFSKGYSDLSPHTSGTNAQQAMDRCMAKCIEFAWCLAAEVVLRDIWPTPECRLVTDWNAYVVESTNTFQNNQWGGTQSIDGENYQTYCNGGSSPCSSSNVFDGGKINSRDGYHCYLQTAT
jgi:surface protein